jgi:hypothetical protein
VIGSGCLVGVLAGCCVAESGFGGGSVSRLCI